jgi:hypothetical protein
VRDLELVDSSCWHAALALLAEPPLRDVVTTPAYLDLGGPRVTVPSYTAWWLSEHPVLGGRRPRDLILGGLDQLYDAAPDVFDAEFLRAIGVWGGIDDVVSDIDGVAELLDRLADLQRAVGRSWLPRIYAALAASPAAREVAPPSLVRAVRGGVVEVVRSTDAVVVDAPDLLSLIGRRAIVPVPITLAADLAEILAVPLATDLPAQENASTGEQVDDPAGDYVRHEPLLVPDIEGNPQRVAWRVQGGVVHVDAERLAFGLGRGRAWLAGDWRRRHLLTALLANPDDDAELQAEAELD